MQLICIDKYIPQRKVLYALHAECSWANPKRLMLLAGYEDSCIEQAQTLR